MLTPQALNTALVPIVRGKVESATSRTQTEKHNETHNLYRAALLEKIAQLEENLLLKIAVDAPRGTLTTLSCVREGETTVCAIDPMTREVNVAASHTETLHSAPKNRTSEQMQALPYLYPDGWGVASYAKSAHPISLAFLKTVRGHHRRWSLVRYIDYALLLAGSAFTVGIANDKPYYPPVPAIPKCSYVLSGIVTIMPEPSHAKPAKPKPAQVTSTKPKPVHVMPAKPKPAQVTSTKPKSAYVTSSAPGPAHIMAALPGSVPVMTANPKPVHKMAAIPEPVHKMAAIPKPVHKMAAIPKPVHKMAANPKPVHKMDAIPKPVHKMAAIPKSVHKMVVPSESPVKIAATPEPHQSKIVSFESHLISAAPKAN
ncbi:Foot protein 1 variant 1 [Labeo rohita]|uniref:Foot protein 1 variant 1 n=1 Tax=Labeo rohita TaxID=84645 RepID=A0ABQ8L4X0_LABRO|nr:Foot protein 1 variant 1 [Labeo rohita]